ncbi:MAG: UDP-N-acetylglucosamine 1-carboxyvinyltransferase [Patescibacteria group bacterium]
MINPTIIVEGKSRLSGSVRVSGSKDSALKLIAASLFSNDQVFIENVPRVPIVEDMLIALEDMGVTVEWSGTSKLLINGATINTHEIPSSFGSKYREAVLLVPALVFRFGKALLPKLAETPVELRPINRLVETWEKVGMLLKEDDKFHFITGHQIKGANINFRLNTHIGTDIAILSTIFATGESTILNAAEEPEIEDLVNFCNAMGAEITRIDARTLSVQGKPLFQGTSFVVQGDKDEVVLFTVASLITQGNLTVSGAQKAHLLSFVNVLTKIGATYEFSGKDELRVWYASDNLSATNITTSVAPGFLTDWQYVTTVLLTQAQGESLMHETIYTDNFEYTKDLNRMGARIQLYRPTELGLQPIVSNDSYDIETSGEPYTVAKIKGPTKLKGTKLYVNNAKQGAALVLAALAAEGKSEITNYALIEKEFFQFFTKLLDLDAHISA